MEAASMAAAAVGGAGLGLFSYNRENYMMDQKNHYARFTAGLNSAVAQTKMYREDIMNLTELTCTRQDCYHGIAAMGITVLTALYVAGRLGFHAAAPPGWLMGLMFVNIAGCYMFMALTIWLAMHASMRADTAATHMLTRFVRLPIPSQGMLDKARKFLSSFEEQPLSEVFRIPFTRHARARDPAEDFTDYGFSGDLPIDEEAKKRMRYGDDVPAWYRKEKALDCKDTIDSVESMLPLAARGFAPEHFEGYRALQMEWFPYDVYARLSIFLAFMHLTHAWAYNQIGHQLQENRAVFAAGICILPLFVLQQIILTLDVLPDGPPIHRLGPCAIWFAYFAGAVEYKRWYTLGAQIFGFVMVYFAYAIHVVYTLQLIRLCAPAREAPAAAETPGASWWPSEWRLPMAFQHAIWLVAPPKQLERGQNDLVGELRAAQFGRPAGGSGPARVPSGVTDEERRADVHRALGKQGESPAWVNVRIGLEALVIAWLFLIVGFSVEISNQGSMHPSLMLAPGLSQHSRDPRYRDPKPGYKAAPEVGTGGATHAPAAHWWPTAAASGGAASGGAASGAASGGSASGSAASGGGAASGSASGGSASGSASGGASSGKGHRRRLEEATSAGHGDQEEHVLSKLRSIVPYLQRLARGDMPTGARASAPWFPASPGRASPLEAAVSWPQEFEPQVLACGHAAESALALSHDLRGVLLTMQADKVEENLVQTAPFVVEGGDAHGPLVAASWGSGGLLLLTASGTTLECPGTGPQGGRWGCEALPGAKLPIAINGKRFAGSAAISRSAAGLHAAVTFPDEASVTVFARAGTSWLPAGQVRTAAPGRLAAFVAAGEALLFAAADGAIAEMDLGDGTLSAASPSIAGHRPHGWMTACRLPSGGFARLVGGADVLGLALETKLVLG